jgi:hypothetical protein
LGILVAIVLGLSVMHPRFGTQHRSEVALVIVGSSVIFVVDGWAVSRLT